MSRAVEELGTIAEGLRLYFAAQDEAREKALRGCRQIIRYSGDSIRALHRQEHHRARQLLDSAHELLRELNLDLAGHGRLRHSGCVHDAQKEMAEAYINSAFIGRHELPGPEDLNVSNAAYLDGLVESVGELCKTVSPGPPNRGLRRFSYPEACSSATCFSSVYL